MTRQKVQNGFRASIFREKFEIRMSKLETNPNFEFRTSSLLGHCFGFGISDFELLLAVHDAPEVLQNRDLLPDFARETGGEVFDVVDGIEQDGVLEALHVKSGNFADEGEGLGAIIQVTIHFEGGHRTFDVCRAAGNEIALGVFGKLMHVNDVGHSAQFVDCFQRTVALDPSLPAYEEDNGGADKND